jgi:hypothetical protein
MRDTIKSNRLYYKIGSFEWMTVFGLPVFSSLLGIIFSFQTLYVNMKGLHSQSYLVPFILIMSGIILYMFQYRKLKFKSFKLNIPLSEFKELAKSILKENGWEFEYDNNIYLQAVKRSQLLSPSLITLKYLKNEIRWNVIHHPQSKNSIASLIAMNLKGKRIVRKIIANA